MRLSTLAHDVRHAQAWLHEIFTYQLQFSRQCFSFAVLVQHLLVGTTAAFGVHRGETVGAFIISNLLCIANTFIYFAVSCSCAMTSHGHMITEDVNTSSFVSCEGLCDVYMIRGSISP